MFTLAKAPSFAPLVLRAGLSIVIIWFGAQQLLNPEVWTVWVPEWATSFGLDAITLVYINGAFEVVAGILLLLGVFVPFVSFLLFLHVCVIVFDIGLTPIGVRDFGLATALLALAMLTYKPRMSSA